MQRENKKKKQVLTLVSKEFLFKNNNVSDVTSVVSLVIKKFCRNYYGDKRDYKLKQKVSAAESKCVESSSDSESAGLVVQHAMTS